MYTYKLPIIAAARFHRFAFEDRIKANRKAIKGKTNAILNLKRILPNVALLNLQLWTR
jgi:hypothetical protein